MEISWVPAHANNYSKGRAGQKPIALVNHVAMGHEAGTTQHFQDPHAGVSAHYLITRSGRIVQFVRLEDSAHTNGNIRRPNLAAVPWLVSAPWQHPITANSFTVTIEWEGIHTGGAWVPVPWGDKTYSVWVERLGSTWWSPSEQQYQAGLWLHRKLILQLGIQVDRAFITRHSDYDSVVKPYCPGQGFPMQRLLDDLKIGVGMGEILHVDYGAARGKIGPHLRVKDYPTISPQVFEDVLLEHRSPVTPYADDLYQLCRAHRVNPAVALAFFKVESQCGTGPGVVREKNTRSWGNLVADRSLGTIAKGRVKYDFRTSSGEVITHYFRVYTTWQDGLKDWLLLWDKPIYQQHANSLRDQIVEVYDPGNIAYHERVMAYVETWLERSRSFDWLEPPAV